MFKSLRTAVFGNGPGQPNDSLLLFFILTTFVISAAMISIGYVVLRASL